MPLRHRVRLALAAGLIAGAMSACSSPNYTVEEGKADLLADTDLTDEQADCVLDAIQTRYAEEYRTLQEANGITEINEQAEEVYVKNRLASTTDLDAADRTAMDAIVTECVAS